MGSRPSNRETAVEPRRVFLHASPLSMEFFWMFQEKIGTSSISYHKSSFNSLRIT